MLYTGCMRRWLIYLTIFSLFFGLSAVAVAFLVKPDNLLLVWGWLGLVGMTAFSLSCLVLCLLQSLRPDHRLPELLVKSTLFDSGLIGIGVVGILVLRWWNGGLLQIILWCIILLSAEWLARSRKGDDQEVAESSKLYMKRHKRTHSRR